MQSRREEYKTLQLIKQETPKIVRDITIKRQNTRLGSYSNIYDAIRSGDTRFFENTTHDLHEIEVAYAELKIRMVPLTFETEVCVEKLLLKQRLFTRKTDIHLLITAKERIQLMVECFVDLKKQSEYNEVFHFEAKFLVRNLRILKRQLKRKQPFFSKLPWEEMEFCFVAFLRAVHGLEEQDFLTRLVFDKNKIVEYFGRFLKNLSCETPLNNFEDLCKDYRSLKDVYSLNRILYYIDHAVDANLDEAGKLVIQRALQVMGEYLKNTFDSPHISETIENRLVAAAPKYLKDIMTSLRNSLSHAHSLAKKILMEEHERQDFFEGIRNDLKKVAVEITIIILDLKCEICREFLNKRNWERDVSPFWYETVNQAKYETEEFKQNRAILEKLKGELQTEGYEAVANFVNLEIGEMLNKENAYSNLLNTIYCIIDGNLDFSENLMEALSLGEQTVDHSEQLVEVADNIGEFSKSGVALTNEIVENAVFSAKKIKQIDRYNSKISEKKYELEINQIFQQIESFMKCEKEINTFWKNVNKKKLLHETKMKILQKLYEGDANDILPLIRELDVSGKAGKNLEEALQEKRLEDLVKQIKKINDPYDVFLKNMLEANFFINDKYIKTLKQFFKKSVPIKEDIINDFINATTQKIENYLQNRLQTLKTVATLHEIAVETIMLDVCEIYSTVTPPFDGVGLLDAQIPFLIGKNLRNYLAHGDPLIDILEYNPKVSLNCHAQSLSTMETTLFFGSEFYASPTELKESYTKGLSYALNQNELFQAIKNGNLDAVENCLSNGADAKGVTVDGKTVLHLSAAANNIDIFKLFLNDNTKIADSICQVAIAEDGRGILEFVNQFPSDFMRIALANSRIEIVDFLLKRGFDVNVPLDADGNTALHLADAATIKLLLKNIADVETKNKYHRTALHNASCTGCFEVVEELANRGANVNVETHEQLTPLHLACISGHDKIVRFLLEKGAEPNTKSLSFSTPLFYACVGGYKNCVEVLLEAKADTNSALMIAAAAGHKEIVLLLLENGVRPVNENALTLFEAALNGFEEIVEILLKAGADVDEKFDDDRTALHAAVQNGHCDVMNLLLKCGAKIDAVSKQGHTPLFAAAHNGFIEVVRLLLKNGANPNATITTKYGNRPIHSASLKGYHEIVKLLCKHKISQNDLNQALCLAAQNSQSQTARVLLANGANPEALVKMKSTTKNHVTALHNAILANDCKMVKLLLDAGATPTAISAMQLKSSKETALHFAARQGYKEIVELLVERHAELVNVGDDEGRTPIFYAMYYGHKDVVQLLLENAAEIQTSFLATAVVRNHIDVVEVLLKHHSDLIPQDDTQNQTSLLFAISKGYIDIAEVLLQHGARIEYLPQEKQYSPLHLACISGNINTVTFLLSKKANVNIEDSNGITPLHYAVRRGQENIVKSLLEHGADFTKNNKHDSILHGAVAGRNVRIAEMILEKICGDELFKGCIDVGDAEGDTPLMWAAESGLEEMVELLLKNGASVNLRNKDGKTALQWASDKENLEVVRILLENGADHL